MSTLTPDSATTLISFRGVSVTRSRKSILDQINWDVSLGERWVIIGPNGAGKTTLLSIIASYLFPSQGEVRILGSRLGQIDTAELKTRIGMTSASLLNLVPEDERAGDIVLSSAYAVFGRWQEEYDPWDESRSSALLSALGVRELKDRIFSTLSEGEKKRVMIARALMPDPELLLMDEPAAGLDLGGREDLLRRISELSSDPSAPATIMVTHHLEEIPAGTTHLLVLKDGRSFAQGRIEEILTSDLLSDLYGMRLELDSRHGRYFARSL
ncbi:MAG: ABC transporter ATP-binding protein [Candidatus Nanopelagicaceae bacterium]|jgi:iron complex transport system ATP-binding protein